MDDKDLHLNKFLRQSSLCYFLVTWTDNVVKLLFQYIYHLVICAQYISQHLSVKYRVAVDNLLQRKHTNNLYRTLYVYTPARTVHLFIHSISLGNCTTAVSAEYVDPCQRLSCGPIDIPSNTNNVTQIFSCDALVR